MSKSSLKNFLKIFLLTALVYPRPVCTWFHSGIYCRLLPPPFGVLALLFANYFDILMIGVITILTKKMLKLTIDKNILSRLNERKRKIVLFLLAWILSMLVISIPYYLFSRYIHPTGGIE